MLYAILRAFEAHMRLVRTKLLWRILAAILSLSAGSAISQSTPDIVWQTNAHFAPVTSVAFSKDAAEFASGSQDRTAKVFSVPSGVLVQAVRTFGEWVLAVALSPDASLLATGGDEGGTSMWRVADGVRLWQTGPSENLIRSTVFAPDGLHLADASHDGDIVLHDARTGAGLPFYGHADSVTAVAFSPDGSRLASSSLDGTARIWRVTDRTTLHVLMGHSIIFTNEDDVVINPVWDVDFSPDGALLATVGADATIRLWSVADGMEVRVINCMSCGSVNFSADGKILFTSGGAIQVWRVSDGQLLYHYTDANAGPLAVASDGKYFAYGRADGAVVLARVPVVVDEVREGGQIILSWSGGSGLYRIQRRNDPTRGVWHNFGPPTTATSFTNEITREPVFYRVISLPNP